MDTNGQNARYVQAARKHGRDRKVLRAFAIGNSDPAGVVARFELAARQTESLVIRSAHRATNVFGFPADIEWTPRTEPEIRELIRDADVLHLNNSPRPLMHFRIAARGKPLLLHHHGTLFRNDPEWMLERARQMRAVQAVSTVDLQRFDPKVLHWLPSAYDLDELAAIRQVERRPEDGRVLIAHAPSNRSTKHTELLIAAVGELQADGLPVDLDLIERVGNAECLRRKARADILFDQLAYGYGCNSIEAWGMGIPVVSGSDEWTMLRMVELWGDLPYYPANRYDLVKVLRSMVGSERTRAEWAEKGRLHAATYHAQVPALERLAELYAMAIRHRGKVNVPIDPVTFEYHGPQTIRVYGETVPFPGGRATITDPDVAARLRALAKRKYYGMIELEQDEAAG